MKMRRGLVKVVKELIEEIQVSFPVDAAEAQQMLEVVLRRSDVIRVIRSVVELESMEGAL